MSRKPRILLIPNVAWWIIGEMGKQIVARFSDKYDFYFVPEGLFERRPELLHTFISSVDAIHCLNESSIELFRNLDQPTLPPIATWIHHVTSWSPQHQLAMERSSALTVCTESWKQYLAARAPAGLPVTVIPHGVDLGFFRRRERRPGSFGIPSDRFVVGFIGCKGSDFDGGRKGTDVLLEVVRKAGIQLPNLHVVLVGPGWESELAGLGTLGISASATGYIRKSDLPALYSALDAYLLTSRVEGGPCTVFEAMACETAVVSTRVGAVPELIVDGVNGYSADVDDVESLLKSIVAIGRSPESRREIGMNARETVSKLPWGAVLAPLESVYDSLIESRIRSGATERGPSWMRNPEELLRTSSAADAWGNVIGRFRMRTIGPVQGMKLLFEMIDRKSIPDLIRGLAMLRGLTY
jgi:glycosyltransferase involved in cell wall biosynthesis